MNTFSDIWFAKTNPRAVEQQAALNTQPIPMTSPNLRRHVRKLIEHSLPAVVVVSHKYWMILICRQVER